MDEKSIREFLEELDPDNKIPEDRKEDFIQEVIYREAHPIPDGTVIDGITYSTLEEQMANETDWRKKASIAARIISKRLEE
jgi:hypothetical protein